MWELVEKWGNIIFRKKDPRVAISERDVGDACFALTGTKFCSLVSCRACPFRSKQAYVNFVIMIEERECGKTR